MKESNSAVPRSAVLSIALLLLLAGCGAGGDGFLEPGTTLPGSGPGPGSGPINIQPVANAGVDQYIASGAIVMLDGSASRDPDGNTLTHSWQFNARPVGSNAVLSDSSSVAPTFRADRPGLYSVGLVVSDGSLASTADSVDITAVNSPAAPNAGPDQNVDIGTLVTLDGSGSTDLNGDSLTYHWQMQGPWQSAAVLSNPDVINPTFIPDVPGIYTCYLSVYDGIESSGQLDHVDVAVSLTAVANAGPDQYHTSGPSTLITLDGSGSHDSAGRSMTYIWNFTRKPVGSIATLSDPSSVNPTFTADLEGKYDLSLEIHYNGYVNSLPDAVTVVVIADRPIAGLPFKVIDAEYSRQLDRIVMVAGTPSSQLHIYDPVTNLDQSIDLSNPPTSVSISPDGLYAAIGHSGIISYTDLVSRSVITTLHVAGNIADLVLGGNGYVYAFSQLNPFVALNINTGASTVVNSGGGIKARLHPSGLALYTTIDYVAIKYDISSGVPVYLYSSDNIPGLHYTVGNDIWITEDGTSLITQSGNIFSASSGSMNDMMQPKMSLGMQSRYVSDSSAAAQLALIPASLLYSNVSIGDTELWMYDHNYGFLNSIALPHFMNSGSDYAGHGKFVFFNSTGTTMFVIMQADTASGLADDFGLVTY